MPVVEIIGVIAMTDGSMTAVRTVFVGVVVPVFHGSSRSSGGSMVGFDSPGQARAKPA